MDDGTMTVGDGTGDLDECTDEVLHRQVACITLIFIEIHECWTFAAVLQPALVAWTAP